MLDPERMKKVRDEIRTHVLNPYLREGGKENPNLWEILDYENSSNLIYYGYCFNESLRIEPPVHVSSVLCFSEDVELGKYKIKKDEQIFVHMHSLYHKDSLWIEHEKFIPERFDPSSKYALTPKGEKRPHYAFVPFLGGKRICLGKTFVEVISKISGPTILGHYDFEFLSE